MAPGRPPDRASRWRTSLPPARDDTGSPAARYRGQAIDPGKTFQHLPFARADPRVEVVLDDARHYILTTKEKFDIITSDPIHPWVKGSASLYSRDYFELVRRHLNPGGVVSQWLPLYQASLPTVRSEMATFFSVFPNGTVWCNGQRDQDLDLVMLSAGQSKAIDLDALDRRLKRPDHQRAARSLAEVGYRSAVELMASYTGRRRDLAPWLAGAPVNQDRKPWLQYQAGLDSYAPQKADVYGAIAGYRQFPDDLFEGSEELQQELQQEFEASGEAGAEN